MKILMILTRPFYWLRGGLQFLGPLLNAFLLLACCHGFFHWIFPPLASHFLGRSPEVFETVPTFLGGLYVLVIALVIAAFVMANPERRRAFLRPILSLLTGDPTHPAGLPLFRYVVLGGLPFVLAFSFSTGEQPEAQPVSKLKVLPKGPTDDLWKGVPAQRYTMFSKSSRLVAVKEAYARVAKKGERVAVQVQFRMPKEGPRRGKELCELWWLDRIESEPMPGVLGGLQRASKQPMEGWQSSVAPIASETKVVVLRKGARLSPKYYEPNVEWARDGEQISVQFSGALKAPDSTDRFLALRLQTGSQKVLLRSAWSKCSWVGMAENAKSSWWLIFVFFLIELVFMTLASSGGTEI